MNARRFAIEWLIGVIASVGAILGCSGLRVSGYRHGPGPYALGRMHEDEDAYAVDVSTKPARRRPQDYLPKEYSRNTMFYSDLGPATIDVSGYPPVQQENYAVYSRVCSQCHTLARSINAPVASRGFWRLYMLGMRFNTSLKPETKFSEEDREAILDFLEYDSHFRKAVHRSEFEELTDELKRRFDPILKERVREMREND